MKKTALIASTLALALAAAGCGGGHEAATGGAAEPEPLRARLAEAVRTELPSRVEIAGTVTAEQVAEVSARVSAAVTAVHVAAGDRVARGQLLIEIDPQPAAGQTAQAGGALAQARSGLALARRNHERYQALAATDAASELEVDLARTQLEQAEGAVRQAEGALSSAEAVAGDARVTAPFGGRVARRMVEVGDLAGPGRPLLTIESEGGRRLTLSVPESLAAGLALGDRVAAAVDARPDLGEMTATVVEMAPGADPVSHAVAVELALPDGASAPGVPAAGVAALATGSAGRAWIETGRRAAVTVPEGAVLRHGGLELVVVRGDDGRASTRAVTLGAVVDGAVEVLSGLDGGETVAVGLGALPPAGARLEPEAG